MKLNSSLKRFSRTAFMMPHLSPHEQETSRMKPIIRTVAFGAAMAFAAAGAFAQDIQERTIKFGHLNNTDHPVSMGVRKFAELVAAKSGGKLKVQEFPSSTLGNELQQQS